MDENKELLTQEFESENNNSDADTVTEQQNTEEIVNDSDAFADITNEEVTPFEYNSYDAPTKKKHLVQVPIIISLVIVAVVALGFLVFKCFFDTSIVGTWVQDNSEASADEASETSDDGLGKPYYVFNNDFTATVYVGTIKYAGEYTVETGEDGTRTVTLNIPAANLQASFAYEVSGNIFTGRKLVFTNTYYDSSIELNSANCVIPDLDVDESFEPSDKITGKWIYSDGYSEFSYEFRNDGTITLNQLDQLIVDGVYTYTDDIITMKYYASDEATMEIAYSVDGDTMYINGYPYVREGSASADQLK